MPHIAHKQFLNLCIDFLYMESRKRKFQLSKTAQYSNYKPCIQEYMWQSLSISKSNDGMDFDQFLWFFHIFLFYNIFTMVRANSWRKINYLCFYHLRRRQRHIRILKIWFLMMMWIYISLWIIHSFSFISDSIWIH